MNMNNCGDSYVVRIYRREEDDPERIVGLVEIVGSQTRHFASREDLWSILNISTEQSSKASKQ
jgi:hypothetical protein